MRLLPCILMAALLCGCAAKHLDTLRSEQFEQLPRKHAEFDFRLAWDSTVSDNGVTVAGVIWNVRWPHAEGVEVWVSLVAPDGTVLAKAVDLIAPNPLDYQEKSGFSVRLPVKPAAGSKLLFTYRYSAVEDPEGSLIWMQSFEDNL